MLLAELCIFFNDFSKHGQINLMGSAAQLKIHELIKLNQYKAVNPNTTLIS